LIAKCEDRVRQRGNNFIGLELKKGVKGELPKIKIISHGGEKTQADPNNQPKILKVLPKDDRYELEK
jgi:hypothetical protein